jgi:hypothetical protein
MCRVATWNQQFLCWTTVSTFSVESEAIYWADHLASYQKVAKVRVTKSDGTPVIELVNQK